MLQGWALCQIQMQTFQGETRGMQTCERQKQPLLLIKVSSLFPDFPRAICYHMGESITSFLTSWRRCWSTSPWNASLSPRLWSIPSSCPSVVTETLKSGETAVTKVNNTGKLFDPTRTSVFASLCGFTTNPVHFKTKLGVRLNEWRGSKLSKDFNILN